jgi:hypothetical protein
MRFSEPPNVTRFTYNPAHQITGSVDSTGACLFANVYDGEGRIVSQDDGVDTNHLATFAWNESNGVLTTTYRDRTGATSTFLHDAGYHLLKYTDPLHHA